MTVYRHLDFEPPGWGELANPPIAWPTYAQRVLALNPLAYWRLGDATGQPAIDAAGNLASGTYTASTLNQQTGAIAFDPDGAVRLDGNGGEVNFPNTNLLDSATQGTILFWMNYHAASVTADSGVVARWSNTQGGGFAGWMIWVDETASVSGNQRTLTFSVSVSGGSAARIEGDTDLVTPHAWDFYAVTFTGGQELRIYKNGQVVTQKTTNTSSFANTNHSLRLGRTGGTIGHLPASLDEVSVFDTALSADDIAMIYDTGLGQLRLPQAEASS